MVVSTLVLTGKIDIKRMWSMLFTEYPQEEEKAKGANSEADSKANQYRTELLRELPTLFLVVDCGVKHRFTAKPHIKAHHYHVICQRETDLIHAIRQVQTRSIQFDRSGYVRRTVRMIKRLGSFPSSI